MAKLYTGWTLWHSHYDNGLMAMAWLWAGYGYMALATAMADYSYGYGYGSYGCGNCLASPLATSH